MPNPDAVLSSRHGTPFVELRNGLLSRLSDSSGMTPWEVIEEALLRKRPARNMKWLAEQLDERIQTVSNWKARGVPARRFREIAKALDLTVDQIEGLEALPWEKSPEVGLLPDVAELAQTINDLPEQQRRFVIETTRLTISHASGLARPMTDTTPKLEPKRTPSTERARKSK